MSLTRGLSSCLELFAHSVPFSPGLRPLVSLQASPQCLLLQGPPLGHFSPLCPLAPWTPRATPSKQRSPAAPTSLLCPTPRWDLGGPGPCFPASPSRSTEHGPCVNIDPIAPPTALSERPARAAGPCPCSVSRKTRPRSEAGPVTIIVMREARRTRAACPKPRTHQSQASNEGLSDPHVQLITAHPSDSQKWPTTETQAKTSPALLFGGRENRPPKKQCREHQGGAESSATPHHRQFPSPGSTRVYMHLLSTRGMPHALTEHPRCATHTH